VSALQQATNFSGVATSDLAWLGGWLVACAAIGAWRFRWEPGKR